MSELLLGEDNPNRKKPSMTEQEMADKALKLLMDVVPNLPKDLALVYVRGGKQDDGFTCIAAKWISDGGKGYRIHFHEGLHADMDQSLPHTRLRCLDEITYGEGHPGRRHQ